MNRNSNSISGGGDNELLKRIEKLEKEIRKLKYKNNNDCYYMNDCIKKGHKIECNILDPSNSLFHQFHECSCLVCNIHWIEPHTKYSHSNIDDEGGGIGVKYTACKRCTYAIA